jgi:uncharacterized membrane protein YeaQ/YmgE (transglycosylase-associated protein family)
MGLVFLLVVGGLLGWLAAIIMRIEDTRGVAANVAVGIAGALVAGLVVHPLLGGGSLLEGRYSVDGLLTALVGSIVVLLAINLLRDREGQN